MRIPFKNAYTFPSPRLLSGGGSRSPLPGGSSPAPELFPFPQPGGGSPAPPPPAGPGCPLQTAGMGAGLPGWRQPRRPLAAPCGVGEACGGSVPEDGGRGAVSLHLGAGWEWGEPAGCSRRSLCRIPPRPSPAVCPVQRAYSVSRDEVAEQGSKTLRKCIIRGGCPT